MLGGTFQSGLIYFIFIAALQVLTVSEEETCFHLCMKTPLMGREKLPAQNSGSAGLIAFACGLLMQYCTNVIERHFVASSCLGLHATLDTLVVSGKLTVSSAFLTQGIGNRQRVGICQPLRKPFI